MKLRKKNEKKNHQDFWIFFCLGSAKLNKIWKPGNAKDFSFSKIKFSHDRFFTLMKLNKFFLENFEMTF